MKCYYTKINKKTLCGKCSRGPLGTLHLINGQVPDKICEINHLPFSLERGTQQGKKLKNNSNNKQ